MNFQEKVVRMPLKKWKRVARRIADLQTRILLSLFYFFLITPFALLLRLVADPLRIKGKNPKGWQLRPEKRGDVLEEATRQF